MTLAALLFVTWPTLSMRRRPERREGQPEVTVRRVFVTTLRNHRALNFGLVRPRAKGMRLRVNSGLLGLSVSGVGMARAARGALLRRSGGSRALSAGWRRAASLWRGALAGRLFGHAVALA